MAHHEQLDKATFEHWRAGAQILERDAHGDKVLWLANGLILKLFRCKDWRSSGWWRPYSGRFARHARALAARGIPTVTVRALYRLRWSGHSAVLYDPLPGEPLRDLGRNGRLDAGLAEATGRFIATLHRQGVLFRSLHLGNILRLPDGRLGLIDIGDLGTWPWALGDWQRGRNFQHFFRYTDNRWVLSPANATALLAGYRAEYPGSPALRARLDRLLAEHCRQFTGAAP